MNVEADGKMWLPYTYCGTEIHLKDVQVTVQEVRRDIWEFTINHKNYLEQKFEIWRIYMENLTYTVYTEKN